MTHAPYTPTIHLNGTHPQTLQDAIADAMIALTAAIDAVTAAAPNARDYYPQGPLAYPAAARAHASQLARLLTVRDELEATSEAIDAARGSR